MSPNSPDILLCIDVGNTSTQIGAFRLVPRGPSLNPFLDFRIDTEHLRTPSAIARHWKPLNKGSGFTAVIISSVVPQINRSLAQFLHSRHPGATIQFVSAAFSGRLKIRYKVPRELGADRIVNGRGAMAYAPGAAIVVDFGTATTFDCLSAKQEFLGGVIAPGPVISAEALFARTAKLPMVRLTKPAPIIGRDTLESISAGLYHGYRGMVMEIVRQLQKKLGPQTTLLATGGQAPLILNGLPVKFRNLPYLTLTGLMLLWLDHRDEKVISL